MKNWHITKANNDLKKLKILKYEKQKIQNWIYW